MKIVFIHLVVMRRPKFDISREQLEYFLFYDLGVQDIANALSVSKSTVQRRFREHEISVSSAMSQLTISVLHLQGQHVALPP